MSPLLPLPARPRYPCLPTTVRAHRLPLPPPASLPFLAVGALSLLPHVRRPSSSSYLSSLRPVSLLLPPVRHPLLFLEAGGAGVTSRKFVQINRSLKMNFKTISKFCVIAELKSFQILSIRDPDSLKFFPTTRCPATNTNYHPVSLFFLVPRNACARPTPRSPP